MRCTFACAVGEEPRGNVDTLSSAEACLTHCHYKFRHTTPRPYGTVVKSSFDFDFQY